MADDKKVVEGRIQIKNVRISFCDALFVAKGFKGNDGKEDESKAKRFKSNFLFPKTSAGQSEQGVTAKYKGVVGPVFALLKKAKHDAIVVKLGEEKATAMASKIKPDKYAIRDGDLETWDGYEDNFYVSAANQRPPKVVGRDPKHVLKEEDGIIYAGCYVNVIFTLWYQAAGKKGDNIVPHAVWATLNSVQFVEKGDAFGASEVDPETEFENIAEGEEVNEDDFDEEDSPL